LISLIEGAELVRLARVAVEKYLQESIIIKSEKHTLEKAGVFVTTLPVARRNTCGDALAFRFQKNRYTRGW
jgi:AMMECR1 domain-containing protein